jgi:hypothetical protein
MAPCISIAPWMLKQVQHDNADQREFSWWHRREFVDEKTINNSGVCRQLSCRVIQLVSV